MTELSLEEKLKEKLLEGTKPEEIIKEVVEDIKKPDEEISESTENYLTLITRIFLETRKKERQENRIAEKMNEVEQEFKDFTLEFLKRMDNLNQEISNLRFESIEREKKDDDSRALEERALIKLIDTLDKM